MIVVLVRVLELKRGLQAIPPEVARTADRVIACDEDWRPIRCLKARDVKPEDVRPDDAIPAGAIRVRCEAGKLTPYDVPETPEDRAKLAAVLQAETTTEAFRRFGKRLGEAFAGSRP